MLIYVSRVFNKPGDNAEKLDKSSLFANLSNLCQNKEIQAQHKKEGPWGC